MEQGREESMRSHSLWQMGTVLTILAVALMGSSCPGEKIGGPSGFVTVEQEPNNSCETATTATFYESSDSYLHGTLSTTEDTDHFKMTLPPGIYHVAVSGSGSPLPWGIARDASGVAIGGSTSAGGSFTFTLETSTQVCIGIYGGEGAYALTVSGV
jgi:hypothetical protein